MGDPLTLEQHDAKSDARAESIKQTIRDQAGYGEKTTGDDMSGPGNYFSESAMGAGGLGGMGGFGSGIVGGVLGGLLFDRGFDRGGRETNEIEGTETRIQDNIYNTAVLSKLGAIEAAIPYNEAQVQLALAATQSALTAQATANANATALATGMVKDSVQNSALIAQKNASDILQAIANSTTTLVSKIDAGTIANLQAELIESRATGRARETEVNVTQNVNQNQQQQQFQVQLQDIGRGLNRLADSHQNLQQGLVNLGTMVGNTQTAANTRVN